MNGPISRRQGGLVDRLTARVTRRGLLAGGGVTGAGLLASQAAWLRSAAQDSAAVREAIDPLATIEAFAVTFVGVGRQRGSQLEFSTELSRFLRAAQCEDEAHYHFLLSAGAAAATRFAVPSHHLRTRDRFLTALLETKEVAVGAAMAAARQFAALGELRLVEIAYQIGAVEAQHLALTRLTLGEQVAADRAFAKWRFASAAEAVAVLDDASFLDDDGDYAFPGPLSRQCRGVTGLVPETTEDQDHLAPATPLARPGDGTA
jgi:hypothetical protein